MVPNLITTLQGSMNELEQRILESTPAIERWFRLEWMEHTPPFYSAVDIRNAGFKLAPVDTTLFPGGWDQLTPQMLPLAVQAAMAAIEKICPEARNLLIIPENHASDPAHLSSVAQLARIFHTAGLNVRIGSIDPEVKEVTTIILKDGERLTLEPVVRNRGRLGTRYFDPCTILLNTDLAAGAPGILEDLHEQYLLPPLHAGWAVRRKSRHFQSYEEVAKRFGKMLGVDPWVITPMFATCNDVDLVAGTGLECLAESVDSVIGKVRRKYKEYGINEKPFVVLKADNGRSGTKVLTVHDAKELQKLGAKFGFGAATPVQAESRGVIVQEGVLTSEHVGGAMAEPVVYMMDRYVVGGFYRVLRGKGPEDSLSAEGARFAPLAFDDSARLSRSGVAATGESPNRFYMYGVIGRLAMLAASYELEATDPEAEVYE